MVKNSLSQQTLKKQVLKWHCVSEGWYNARYYQHGFTILHQQKSHKARSNEWLLLIFDRHGRCKTTSRGLKTFAEAKQLANAFLKS